MTIYASSQARAFYSDEVSSTLPPDAQAISDDLHECLLAGQSEGKLIDFSLHPPRLVDAADSWPSSKELSRRIDDRVADVYARWVRFEPEYAAREKAAVAYRKAGYSGEPGGWIKYYAATTGLSLEAATNLILDKAQQRESTLEALASFRLRKHELFNLEGEARQALYQEIIERVQATTLLLESLEGLPNPHQGAGQPS
ncbi:hypothetical protein [Pseudomonas putida]|uniref:hypothetical protein n=1 Tax=Pseudomonas putida TaxID=303 RepID=UPI0007B96200|nr:hypothetical protein [Pseudomonas putida]